jgi:hypothetical protein
MCTIPILSIPYITKIFILESDAFGKGIGEFLMQEGFPMVFTNKQLCD